MSKKRKKRKKLKIKSVLLFLIFILFIVGCIYLLSFIKVRSYFVYNNKYLKDEEVLKELKLDKTTPFVTITRPTLNSNIKKSKLIKDVKIQRTLNLEVKLNVEEYRILFYDSKNKKTIIETGEKIDYLDVNTPVLTNEIDDVDVFNSFVKRLNKVSESVLKSISEITYSPNGIDKERFLFSMNDGNYVYVTITKLKKINDYKKIIDSLENKKGILYLDYGNYFLPKE